MNAFAAAMDAIFADQNMAVDATWTPQGGASLPVRAIRKAPDEMTTFGAARILSDTTIVDVRVSEMPSPNLSAPPAAQPKAIATSLQAARLVPGPGGTPAWRNTPAVRGCG